MISSHSLLVNDKASLVKKIQRDLKVRTKPHNFFNDVWVRKTLIHSWVLLMVGLGRY